MKNLIINDKITIPARFLSYKAVTASGAGGQNVNKVASKVQLTFELEGLYYANREYNQSMPDIDYKSVNDLDDEAHEQFYVDYENMNPPLISDGALARILTKCIVREGGEPYILITSQKTRDQFQNLEDALEKVKQIILKALEEPVKRIATKATNGSVIKRLRHKKEHSDKKQNRGLGSDSW